MNPAVSKVHGKEKRWGAEFAALRKLCLGSGLNEELKWGQACYDLDGANVVLIHGFKDRDPALAEAFRALTPGRQKGYLLHFAGAKRSATRAARVEKHAPRIMQGLGLDDRGTRADSKELE